VLKRESFFPLLPGGRDDRGFRAPFFFPSVLSAKCLFFMGGNGPPYWTPFFWRSTEVFVVWPCITAMTVMIEEDLLPQWRDDRPHFFPFAKKQ